MRTSSTGIRRCLYSRSRGFTIIELMVALAIVVIMSAVALLYMGPALRDAKMRSSCRIVASMLNYARSRAAATGTTLQVLFNPDRSLEVDTITTDNQGNQTVKQLTTSAGKRQNLPDGISVTRIAKGNGVDTENWVQFNNLGQADAQTMVQLTDDSGQHRYVIIDPITGRCRIATNANDAAIVLQAGH